ncbi:uncharacterized protein TNCV_3843201 [Trichonephila clavipes]|nr:uncharacterized protein TNCV_3843201 [Trichonephila clavipes]
MIDHLGLRGRQRFFGHHQLFLGQGAAFSGLEESDRVIHIKKCGKTDGTPESFRPIALTSIACKITENGFEKTHFSPAFPQSSPGRTGSVLSPTLFSLFLSGIESVIKRKCEVGAFADDIVLWKSDSDLTKLERNINLVLEDIRSFALDHKLTFNRTKSVLSAARIITGLKNTCPRDIVLFEADLQPLSLRRRACLTKYYNKLRSLDSRNRTSAYFKDWCNNQRLRGNSPFSQMVSFNLTIGAVEPHYLSQCLDPADDLDRVFFHPELPVHVNKQADLPAYQMKLAIERIGDIPIDAVQVYMDGSRDDNYRSSSGICIKSQNHILRIQRRNPDGCSVFRSELIAIDEALGSLASLPNGKEIWILSDSRSTIQHLSNWQSVRDNVGVSILKLKRLSTSNQIHLQWNPSHIDLEGNEIADTLAKAGAHELPEPSVPLTCLEIFSRTKHQNKTAWITHPQSTIGIVMTSHTALGYTIYK